MPAGAVAESVNGSQVFSVCVDPSNWLIAAVPTGVLSNLEDAGLQGVSIECPPGLSSDAAFNAFAKTIVTAAKPVVRAVMIYGVAGPRQAAIAGLHGATHASFAPDRPKVHYVDDAAAEPA